MSEIILVENRSFRARLPSFLKQSVPRGPAFRAVQKTIDNQRLKTVCEEAKCPNRTHCYERGTLTFQILGNICTRSCGFCAETFGRPKGLPDAEEPSRIVESAKQLNLNHVVITSPARDDLEDEGSTQFAQVISLFRDSLPNVTVEVLTPDFHARADCLNRVFQAKPDIFNHNIETTRRLTPRVRSKATYDRTLSVLKKASDYGLVVKSGLMVGHGETKEELIETFHDLFRQGTRLLTIGQYLPPSVRHLPLVKIYLPREFEELKSRALEIGFNDVASGPLVRSSYHADESIQQIKIDKKVDAPTFK